MSADYPLHVLDYRKLPPRYDGNVFVWDIDKTYLSTRFSSVGGMARIPVEFAVDKLAIPGMPEVLRGLRRGAGPGYAVEPLYFVTASPPQLRKVLERKMLLDGVEFDGITFKDWVAAFRGGRPGRLREQVGFKLVALLDGRSRRPHATEYLFGDDYEKDATSFSMYAQLLSGELAGGQAEKAMVDAGVREDDRQCIRERVDALPADVGRVKKIFIHLEKGTSPEEYTCFGDRVVPVRGSFQLSLALFELRLVQARAVREAAQAQRKAIFRKVNVEELLGDALERGIVSGERAREAVG